MTKYLIVNSDDFGISEDVSRGIMDAHRNGIVTSTTTMINLPAAEAAVKTAQQSTPNLGIGLHLVLSYGKPVLPPESVPSLVTEEGTFVSTYRDLINKLPTYTADDLERELTAQFERFVAIAGRLPTHIDSHHGSTYMHAAAFDTMTRIAHANNLPIRWTHGAMEPSPEEVPDLHAKINAVIEKNGLPPHPEQFADFIFDFASTPRLDRLKNGLMTIQDGYTELMVHVGYGKELDEGYNFQRDEELAAVNDDSVKQLVADLGIQLITFADLPQ